MKNFIKNFFFIFLFITFFYISNSHSQSASQVSSEEAPTSTQLSIKPFNPAKPRMGWAFTSVGLIPIQNGGRIKPLEAFARETILYMTGRTEYKGWDPVELIISWISFPFEWGDKAFIKIQLKEVKRQLLLSEEQNYFSPNELLKNPVLMQYAGQLPENTTPSPKQAGASVDLRKQELDMTMGRVSLFRAIVNGNAWTIAPAGTLENATGKEGSESASQTIQWQPWKSIQDLINKNQKNSIHQNFSKLIRSYYSGDYDSFSKSTEDLKKNIYFEMESVASGSEAEAGIESSVDANKTVESSKLSDEATNEIHQLKRKIKAESLYHRMHPFQWAWIFYLCAALFWISFLVVFSKKWISFVGWGFLILGFCLHTGGFFLRMYISGRPPVSNMFESVVWVSFGVLVFSFILFAVTRKKLLLAVSSSVGAFALLSAQSAPAVMDPNIHPLVPVLRSNFWLTIHVLTITLSYAAFALAWGISCVTLYHFFRKDRGSLKAQMPASSSTLEAHVFRRQKIFDLNQLAYRALQFGVVLLAAGTILGGVWADYSWGRFWGWDPKEVWALISLLCYLALLHARFTGWAGPFGFAAFTNVSFLSVIMAWYGVNFVLGVGLHSYGFSTGGAPVVLIGCLIQLLIVGVVWLKHRRTVALKNIT